MKMQIVAVQCIFFGAEKGIINFKYEIHDVFHCLILLIIKEYLIGVPSHTKYMCHCSVLNNTQHYNVSKPKRKKHLHVQ